VDCRQGKPEGFSQKRLQKSALLFNPSVICAIASLVKGGGLPQGKPEGFASLVKGGGLPSRQAGGIFSKKITKKCITF
jgi:hypothetical protein